jgi:hypothetical protein
MKQIRQISINDVTRQYIIVANGRGFIPKSMINSSIANKVMELNQMTPSERSDMLNLMIKEVAYTKNERSYTTCGCESHFGLLKPSNKCMTCEPNKAIAHYNRTYKRGFPKLSVEDYEFMWNLHKNILEELNSTEYLRTPIPVEYAELYEAILFPILREHFTDYEEIRSFDKKYIGCDKRFFQFNIYRQHPASWTHEMRQINDSHKDHIRPCAKATLNTKQGIIDTFSWWNFQPLTRHENCSKGGR